VAYDLTCAILSSLRTRGWICISCHIAFSGRRAIYRLCRCGRGGLKDGRWRLRMWIVDSGWPVSVVIALSMWWIGFAMESGTIEAHTRTPPLLVIGAFTLSCSPSHLQISLDIPTRPTVHYPANSKIPKSPISPHEVFDALTCRE